MGNQIILKDVIFTDNNLPVLMDDPILNKGSLLLVDLGHSKGRLSEVPSNSALLNNIASEPSSLLVGSTAVSPDIYSNFTQDAMKIELSKCGGIHAIKSKVTDLNNTRFTLRIPASIKTYMLANRNNSFYFSAWQNVTRKLDDQALPIMVIAEAAYSNNFILNLGGSGLPLGASTTSLGRSTTLNPFQSTGVAKHQTAVAGTTGVMANMPYTDLFIFGGCPSAGVMNAAVNKGGSQILYRLYMEDLTVSGRTYAQVKAQDDLLFNAAFAAGGKFFGDTYTDPATLP